MKRMVALLCLGVVACSSAEGIKSDELEMQAESALCSATAFVNFRGGGFAPFGDNFQENAKRFRLNVRRGPGEDYPVLATLFHGYRVNILSIDGSWAKVEPYRSDETSFYGAEDSTFHETGYVSLVYLDIDTRDGEGYDGAAPILADADDNARQVAKIPIETRLDIVACDGEWLKVEYTDRDVNPDDEGEGSTDLVASYTGWLAPIDQCSAAVTTCP